MTDKTHTTDLPSAAWHYRRALEQISRAQTRHQAIQIAIEALKVTYERPQEGHIYVVGGYGANTQQPYVTLTTYALVTQITAEEAREVAHNILAEAATAEQDGFLFTFLAERMELPAPQISGLVAALRDYRAQFRRDLQEQPPATDDEPPPNIAPAA